MSKHADCYWGSGQSACHCMTCHRSFTSVAHFDKHQTSSGCVDITLLVHGDNSPYAGQPMYRTARRGGETLKDGTVTREFSIITRIAYEHFYGSGE